jgi:hypothetical protein
MRCSFFFFSLPWMFFMFTVLCVYELSCDDMFYIQLSYDRYWIFWNIYMYVYLAVYSYTTFVGRPYSSTMSQNVSMRLFLSHSNQIFLSPAHCFPSNLIIISWWWTCGGMNSAHSHCLPVLNTVPVITNLDLENGNVHKIWQCTYNITLW